MTIDFAMTSHTAGLLMGYTNTHLEDSSQWKYGSSPVWHAHYKVKSRERSKESFELGRSSGTVELDTMYVNP